MWGMGSVMIAVQAFVISRTRKVDRMAAFKYIAKDETGKTVTGKMQAVDERDLHNKLKSENKFLISSKEEIKQVIDAVEDNDERAVLQYRYLKNYSWARIGDLLVADERTVRRWHNKALAHVVIPDNPTII